MRSVAIVLSLLAAIGVTVTPLRATAGSPAGLPSVVDLAVANGPRFDGPGGVTGFGGAGLAVGDVDGDGAPDVVICAPKAEGGRGAAYVFFGRANALPASRDLSSQSADVTIVGAGTTVGLGIAAVVVDLDADGAGELVLSTSGYVPALGRLASGGALIFHGGAAFRARARIDLANERADAAVADAAVPAPVGASLTTGDFDGDGYPDLAVGDPSAPGLSGAARAGRTIVLFGGHDFQTGRVVDAADDDVAVVGGKAAGDTLGTNLASGDATGDRKDDLLLGTPNRTVVRTVTSEKAGSLFVVSGASLSRGARVDLSDDAAAIEVLGAEYGDYLGKGSGVGDVTGDGRPDVVVSAIDGDGPANGRYPDCGELYVLEAPSSSTVDLLQMPEWEWVIGAAPRRFTGDALAVADVDGDRRAEIVASSESATGPNGASSGALYVVSGTPGTLDLADQAAETTVAGPSAGASLGSALVAADLDGDGVRDVIAGAPGGLGGRGSVFVVAGVRTEPDAAPSLASVGDVSIAAGSTTTIELSATDSDGDPIRFEVLNRPPTSTIEDDGDGHARLVVSTAQSDAAHFDVTVCASDGQLSSSETFAIDVVAGDAPVVTKAVFKNGVLKITGEHFDATATIALNGVAVARPVVFKPARGRLVVRGTAAELGLLPTPGANRIVVTVGGLASPPFAF